jgi:hypothetical protein
MFAPAIEAEFVPVFQEIFRVDAVQVDYCLCNSKITSNYFYIQIVAHVIRGNYFTFNRANRKQGDLCSLPAIPSLRTRRVKQSMRVHWIASPCGFAMTCATV